MPKTIKNVYDNAVSFEKLLKSHKKARRGKREKKEIILMSTDLKMLSEFAKINLKLTFNSKTKIFKNIQGVNIS